VTTVISLVIKSFITTTIIKSCVFGGSLHYFLTQFN